MLRCQTGYRPVQSVRGQNSDGDLCSHLACDIIPSCAHRSPPGELVLDNPILTQERPVGQFVNLT